MTSMLATHDRIFLFFFPATAGDDEHVAVGNVGPDLAREAVLLARDWQVALHGRHHQRAAALDRHGLCQKKARKKSHAPWYLLHKR